MLKLRTKTRIFMPIAICLILSFVSLGFVSQLEVSNPKQTKENDDETIMCNPRGISSEQLETRKDCRCNKFWRGKFCHIPNAIESSNITETVIRQRKKSRKIVMGFAFNHELDLLEIRFGELFELIDWFVLVESTFSSHGDPKPLYFNQSIVKFAHFIPKIVHVIIDELPKEGVRTWENEKFLRYAIGGLGISQIACFLQKDDLIIINDADEIPSADVIYFLKHYTGYADDLVYFSYRWSLYGFHWLYPGPTVVAAASNFRYFKTHFHLHGQELRTSSPLLNTLFIGDPAKNLWAGYHCSWCARTAKDLLIKLKSALSGDGKRWGDMIGETDLGFLDFNRKNGRWFDGTKTAKLVVYGRNATGMFAPEYCLKQRKKFQYLLGIEN